MRKYFLAFALVLVAQFGWGVDNTYYASLENKSDAELRQALTVLLYTNHTKFDKYNWDFPFDYDNSGYVWDIYTNGCQMTTSIGTTNTCCCDGVNREHVVCQSTFGQSDSKDKIPQYSDRHHLFLVDAHTNSFRSNYAYGECKTSSDASHGSCDKSSTHIPSEGTTTCDLHSLGWLGTVTTYKDLYHSSQKVYEVADEYKGDIARAILYMVVRYAEKTYCRLPEGAKYCTSTTGTGSTVNASLTTENDYPVTAWINAKTQNEVGQMFSTSLSPYYGLSEYGKAILLKWHRQDAVSQKEKDRNDGVEAVQGNRNPFIDQPDLVEYLWGNKQGQAFTLDGSGEQGETFTVTWMAEGSQHAQNSAVANTSATLPHTYPADCDEPRVFVGWTSNKSVTSRPDDIFSTYGPTITKDTTFYAVYADTTMQSGGDALISFSQDDFEGQGTISTGSPVSATIDNITVACEKAYGDAVALRCYKNSTLTISSTNSTISAIEFAFSGDYTGGLNSTYTNLNTNEWSVTLSSQARLTSVSVTDNSGYTILYSNYRTYCSTPPTYTVTFMDRGQEYAVRQGHEGDKFAEVVNPTPCDDYTFYGWSKQIPSVDNTIAPELFVSTTIPGNDTTLYAIYTLTEGSVTKTTLLMEDYKTVDGVLGDYTFVASKGDGSNTPVYNENNKDARLYAKNTLEISTLEDMTQIVFNLSAQGKKRLAPITASLGTIATQAAGDENVTWTGSASAVTFTVGDKAEYGSDGAEKAGQLCFLSVEISCGGSVTYYTSSPLCSGSTTELEQQNAKTSVQKLLINGQLFILRDGKIYTIQGVRVR